MRINRKIAAVGAALCMVAPTTVLTMGASDNAAPTALERREYVSKATGKTKVIQWTDKANGQVVAEAVVGLGATASVVRDDEGKPVGVDIVPEDPKTDADIARMEAELTGEVSDERRRTGWRPSQMVELPDQAADRAGEGTGSVNRVAPFGLVPNAGSAAGNTAAYDEGCGKIAGEEIYIYGCFRRANVPDGNADVKHTLDSSWSSAHHEGWFGTIRWIKSQHDYTDGHSSVTVLDAKPKYTKDVGSCYEWTIGLEKSGVSANASGPICPTEISLNLDKKFYMHGWFGKEGGDGTWVGSPGHSYVVADAGTGYGFTFNQRALEVDCSASPAGCDFDYYDDKPL